VDKRLLLPVICSCRTPAGAHCRQRARVAHTTGLKRFVAVLLVLVRQMRTRKVGLAVRRHAVTARVAAL
jgi:hypothetical protein